MTNFFEDAAGKIAKTAKDHPLETVLAAVGILTVGKGLCSVTKGAAREVALGAEDTAGLMSNEIATPVALGGNKSLASERLFQESGLAGPLSGSPAQTPLSRFEMSAFDSPSPRFRHETSHGMIDETPINDRTLAALDEARLDSSRAYKVLDIEGRSPTASGVQWSLPIKRTDGTWKPGEWMNVDHTPHDYLINTRRALHVSNVPDEWLFKHNNPRVFEAELAPIDKSIWEKLLGNDELSYQEATRFGIIPVPLRDFPAASVRLTRELGVR